MTMADWASKLDAFLQFNDADILQDKGKVTAAIAKAFAESEFEQYRVIQDRLYQSDFDKLMATAQTDKDKWRICPRVIRISRQRARFADHSGERSVRIHSETHPTRFFTPCFPVRFVGLFPENRIF